MRREERSDPQVVQPAHHGHSVAGLVEQGTLELALTGAGCREPIPNSQTAQAGSHARPQVFPRRPKAPCHRAHQGRRCQWLTTMLAENRTIPSHTANHFDKRRKRRQTKLIHDRRVLCSP